MSAEDDFHNWFDPLLPKVAAFFGGDFDEKPRYELSVPADSLYLSSTVFAKIHCASRKTGDERTVSVVFKRPPQQEVIRQEINADRQFHNEILFYRAKYGQGGTDFPRCLYCEEKPPSDSVIVLENVMEYGYEIYPKRYDVPSEYTAAAMSAIGRFHGRGYARKQQGREEFFKIVDDIQETRFEDVPNNRFAVFINIMATRAIDYLRRRDYDKAFCDKAEAFLGNAYQNVMMKVADVEEPIATLCHGDFTMNNTLFKKTDEGVRAMLIDFAMMRYGSPVIDLSTFLCLTCPNELQKERLTDILNSYCDSVNNYLVEHQIEDRISRQAVYDDFKKHGLFGFTIASFYLAMVMEKPVPPPSEIFKMDIVEAAMLCRESGGDEVSAILANMLVDLREFGCLEHVL